MGTTVRRMVAVCGLVAIAALTCSAKEGQYDPSKAPGTVVHHIPASSGIYVGSPGIIICDDGSYLAKCDEFGPGSAELTGARTVIFRSDDRGKTWQRVSHIDGVYWATLFAHRGAVYLMGTDRQYGDTIIVRSDDQGKKWTSPSDDKHGLLLSDANYHCAPVPIVEHKGRLWRAMEDYRGDGPRNRRFGAFMMSIDADVDLLDASNWVQSNRLEDQPEYLDGKVFGWLEGNAVVTPEGGIVDILRVHRHVDERAAIISISDDGTKATFDPDRDFVFFPGGSKKFTIRFDPESKRYWTLANYIPAEFAKHKPDHTRNTLAILTSTDLRDWKLCKIITAHPDVFRHGYQYADWVFDGNDIIALVRTAHDDGLGGAHNFHDANFLTFHRIESFRSQCSGGDSEGAEK